MKKKLKKEKRKKAEKQHLEIKKLLKGRKAVKSTVKPLKILNFICVIIHINQNLFCEMFNI
jgi:hypothetical protein